LSSEGALFLFVCLFFFSIFLFFVVELQYVHVTTGMCDGLSSVLDVATVHIGFVAWHAGDHGLHSWP
jgi:hypothetical protein